MINTTMMNNTEREFVLGVAALAQQLRVEPKDAIRLFGTIAAGLSEYEALRRNVTDAPDHARTLFETGLAAGFIKKH